MKYPRLIISSILLLLMVLSVTATLLAGEDFPSKPVICVVPFAPGGATDILARTVAASITSYLGQPMVVINKPGGGGAVGVHDVVKSKPDGYTTVLTGWGICTPELFTHWREAPFTSKDLAPIAQVSTNYTVLVVKKDAPWNDMKELMAYAKDHEVKFGGPGASSTGFILGVALAKKFKVNLKGIPFKGDALSIPALLGNHIQLDSCLVASIKPHVDAGTLRILGVADPERMVDMPDVPTLKEQGFDTGIYSLPSGMWAAKGTPADRIKVISDSVEKLSKDESYKIMMEKIGAPMVCAGTEKWAKLLQDTTNFMGNAFKELGYLK